MSMQKFQFIALILVFSGLSLSAQDFHYGISGGLDIAHIRTDLETRDLYENDINLMSHYNSILTYNINASLRYKIDNTWGISLEPGYVRKGVAIHYDINDLPDYDILLDYLQLPVLLDVYATDRLSFSAGPSIELLLFAKEKPDNQFVSLNSFYNKNLEFALMAGAAYQITEMVGVGIRYNRSLTAGREYELRDMQLHPLGHVTEYNHYFQLFFRFNFSPSKQESKEE